MPCVRCVQVLADMQNEWPFSDVYDQSFFVRRIARTLRLRVLEASAALLLQSAARAHVGHACRPCMHACM